MMDAKAKEFLVQLVETPGVSGYETRVQELVRSYARDFVDEMQTDLHGNLILAKNPSAPVRTMLAGHADQIGLIVSSIDDDGYLYTQTVGGWDPQQLVGQRMTVWTSTGPIPGVIARKAIHLLEESERKQVVKAKDLWIDIGATDEEEASKSVSIGDPVTFELRYQDMMNGLANSPGMDNRTGVWVVVEAMRRAVEQGVDCGLFAVSTVQEELGLRGAKTAAFEVDPHVGIAVDVTHATDCPTIDTRQLGKVKLGGGPVVVRGPNVNPVVSERLMTLSDEHDIPVQQAALGRAAPNDSNALQVNRGGVAAGIVAIPNRYMHSAVETIALADIDAAASLLARFVGTIQSREEFIPK